jgi:hypothetical protein
MEMTSIIKNNNVRGKCKYCGEEREFATSFPSHNMSQTLHDEAILAQGHKELQRLGKETRYMWIE